MWLEESIRAAAGDGKRVVVLTHHAPSFHGTCAPQHDGSSIAAGFCSNLEGLLRPPVVAWLFGHTHWSSWQRFTIPRDEDDNDNDDGKDGEDGEHVAAEGGGVKERGHTQPRTTTRARSPWATLTGGVDKWPSSSELAGADAVSVLGEHVLVASNQLGYGAKGDHTTGRGSRCHPEMSLVVESDGTRASLCCKNTVERAAALSTEWRADPS